MTRVPAVEGGKASSARGRELKNDGGPVAAQDPGHLRESAIEVREIPDAERHRDRIKAFRLKGESLGRALPETDPPVESCIPHLPASPLEHSLGHVEPDDFGVEPSRCGDRHIRRPRRQVEQTRGR